MASLPPPNQTNERTESSQGKMMTMVMDDDNDVSAAACPSSGASTKKGNHRDFFAGSRMLYSATRNVINSSSSSSRSGNNSNNNSDENDDDSFGEEYLMEVKLHDEHQTHHDDGREDGGGGGGGGGNGDVDHRERRSSSSSQSSQSVSTTCTNNNNENPRRRRHRRRSGVALPGGSLHSATSLDSGSTAMYSSSPSMFMVNDDLDDDDNAGRKGGGGGGRPPPLPDMEMVVDIDNLNFNKSAGEFLSCDFEDFVKKQNAKDWLIEFKRSDPRYKILNFFNDVAQLGANWSGTETDDEDDVDDTNINGNTTSSPQPCQIDFDTTKMSPLLKAFYKASVFTVWRPCSSDAIRHMMLGDGVGKGLDIKGKSAKKGVLSGFVPFLQIFEQSHTSEIRSLRKDGTVRVFFDTVTARDYVTETLNVVAGEMKQVVDSSKMILQIADSDDNQNQYDEETVEEAMQNMKWDMYDSTIVPIDTYAPGKYGMEVQERLLWEGMVCRQNIHREKGSDDDTGRHSLPSFQDMNFGSLRRSPEKGEPKAVISLYRPPGMTDDEYDRNAMCPLNLVMAYEENDPSYNLNRVIPVVSDFDCFLIGTRGVKYQQQIPEEQLEVLRWCVHQCDSVMQDEHCTLSWTEKWLNVLKSEKKALPEIPSLGFSDPKSNFIFKHAIHRLSKEGAVRHGAECFNYYFPQELDDQFLVISDEFVDDGCKLRWKYVDQSELQKILKSMITRGYTFPLNPKWVLCDKGWKEVYDQLFASQASNVQDSLNCWFPPKSGVRELIEKVHTRHRNGFQRLEDTSCHRSRFDEETGGADGTAAMDLAEQTLKYYRTFQRARRKLKIILMLMRHVRSKRRDEDDDNETASHILNSAEEDQDSEETCIESTEKSQEGGDPQETT